MPPTNATSMIDLSSKSQQGIITYLLHVRNRFQFFYSIRANLENADRNYYRELNWTQDNLRSRMANRFGDASKYQDITVPVVMPQVESAVAYLSSVFLSGQPIFGVVADPEYEDAALAMEAVIEDQQTRMGWKQELILFFRDAKKYNIAACEIPWVREVVPSFETDLGFSATQAKPVEVIWEGNAIRRLDMYNTFWDTSVHPKDVPRYGEYAGYTEFVTRGKLKQVVASLPEVMTKNLKAAYESGAPLNEYYVPQLNPDALAAMSAQGVAAQDWFSWAGVSGGRQDIAYKQGYILTTLYMRLLPSEFDISVPKPNTPQVWKFLIVNQQVVIYAERQTNAHDLLPIVFCCPEDDGIKYQSKSLAANVQPMQAVATALMSASIAARRRAISDRMLYNPLYISEAAINNPNPAAKIPVKPTAYAGVGLGEMIYQIPFRDDQSQFVMQGIQSMMGFADIVSGQNKAQQGQFVKGNKTLHEYQDVMESANSRSQLGAIVLEDQFFTPVKLIIECNILQYQGATELYHTETKARQQVDPVALRNAIYKFKISDGLMPTDKLIGADAWQTAMQVIGSSPAIGAEYNLAGLFSYLMKTQGADIGEFAKPPEQVQYEQAVQAWQQTCAQIVKANPQATTANFPPQPVPGQFAPAQAAGGSSTKQPSIIQLVMEAGKKEAGETSETTQQVTKEGE